MECSDTLEVGVAVRGAREKGLEVVNSEEDRVPIAH